MKDSNGYFYASHTADCIVFNIQAAPFRESGAFVNVLLIKRGNEPFKGDWAIPGGFLNENETLEQCAVRELEEETGVKTKILMPIGTFSNPKRDPRGPVISTAFSAVVPTVANHPLKYKAGDDASGCALFHLTGSIDKEANTVSCKLRCAENGVIISYKVKFEFVNGISKANVIYEDNEKYSKLAFDHAEILARAIVRSPDLVNNSAVKSSPVVHTEDAEKRAVQLHS